MIVDLPFPVRVNWLPKRASKFRDTYFQMTAPFEIRELAGSDLEYVGCFRAQRIQYFTLCEGGGLWARECLSDLGEQLVRAISPERGHLRDTRFKKCAKTILHRSPLFMSAYEVKYGGSHNSTPRKNFIAGANLDELNSAKIISEVTYEVAQANVQAWLNENLRVVDGFILTQRPPPLITMDLRSEKDWRGWKALVTDDTDDTHCGHIACYATRAEEEIVAECVKKFGFSFERDDILSSEMPDFAHLTKTFPKTKVMESILTELRAFIRQSRHSNALNLNEKFFEIGERLDSIRHDYNSVSVHEAFSTIAECFDLMTKDRSISNTKFMKCNMPIIEARLAIEANGRQLSQFNKTTSVAKTNPKEYNGSSQADFLESMFRKVVSTAGSLFEQHTEMRDTIELQRKFDEFDLNSASDRMTAVDMYETILKREKDRPDLYSFTATMIEEHLQAIKWYKTGIGAKDNELAIMEAEACAIDQAALFNM